MGLDARDAQGRDARARRPLAPRGRLHHLPLRRAGGRARLRHGRVGADDHRRRAHGRQGRRRIHRHARVNENRRLFAGQLFELGGRATQVEGRGPARRQAVVRERHRASEERDDEPDHRPVVRRGRVAAEQLARRQLLPRDAFFARGALLDGARAGRPLRQDARRGRDRHDRTGAGAAVAARPRAAGSAPRRAGGRQVHRLCRLVPPVPRDAQPEPDHLARRRLAHHGGQLLGDALRSGGAAARGDHPARAARAREAEDNAARRRGRAEDPARGDGTEAARRPLRVGGQHPREQEADRLAQRAQDQVADHQGQAHRVAQAADLTRQPAGRIPSRRAGGVETLLHAARPEPHQPNVPLLAPDVPRPLQEDPRRKGARPRAAGGADARAWPATAAPRLRLGLALALQTRQAHLRHAPGPPAPPGALWRGRVGGVHRPAAAHGLQQRRRARVGPVVGAAGRRGADAKPRLDAARALTRV
mmetsp:Transcript_29033/g.63550  ORF Transcript_29033/g.63550 Transcript_29033/m.63550 type:complete len:476 (+) Transcript_29033:1804-3231(+)